MITLSILLTLTGFEFFYQTSKKAELRRSEKIARWFGANEMLAKVCGTFLLATALILSVLHLGLGSGVFAFVCMLMFTGSLVVLIAPLGKVKVTWVLAGMITLFILEIL
ncbi:hypothetical protein LZF95_04685 [Algoriphagus sp. AGSA1]|uniref:hypothetical protein n=1 Tax=Algoriphagus sp. AGSA1 TaxID=2907213 RepID=UPI001F290271|nr:hypothetical protein [Algoriphagus sp. AGSA1]MCE7053964.1 hypothetical protein [Algoriphagus sp. AGSA1]